MEQVIAKRTVVNEVRIESRSKELTTELFRKSIHMMISLVPLLAMWNLPLTMTLLACGTIGYTSLELLRQQGRTFALVSNITVAASRDRDRGKFVLGPVMLAVGAFLALAIFPIKAATLGIYALAFGDGLASLAGKFLGRVKIPYAGGKTFAGSIACFAAVFVSATAVLANPLKALPLALAATLIELIPLKDFDNVLIPLGTGALALFLI